MPNRSDTPWISPPPLSRVRRIARFFELPEPLEISDFPEKGNVNRSTYLLAAVRPGSRREYLLQGLNTDVFSDPDAVMETMIACIEAQNKSLSEGVLMENEEWEPIRLVPTKKGEPYLKAEDANGLHYWRVMGRIRRARSFKHLSAIQSTEKRLTVARETGRGLALFGILTAAMDAETVQPPLPGYRNTALYFDQLDSVLEGNRTFKQASAYIPSDPLLRRSTKRFFTVQLNSSNYRSRMEHPQVKKFIDVAMAQRSYCMKLQKNLASGHLKTTIVHGDPKLENFLFNNDTGRVKSLVDLDTVMAHTWLSDWGDMVRSLVNVSGERKRNPDDIRIDMDVFKALLGGFMRSAPLPPRHEVELMVDAARIMTLELGIRFLADHLRGDTYFKPVAGDPEDLNRIRAAVQFSLFRNLGEMAPEAIRAVNESYEERRKE